MHPKREALSGTLTVKSTLVVIVGVLAALVLISCAIAGTEAWRSYTASIRVAEVNANADQLLKGLENIQLERGQTTAIEAIETLLSEELTIREGRRIKAALQMARLTPIKEVVWRNRTVR